MCFSLSLFVYAKACANVQKKVFILSNFRYLSPFNFRLLF
jgi:hypothetical protein